MILISTQCFPPAIGGIESLIHNLASQLHNRGYEVSVFADKTKQDDSSFDLKQPFNIQRFSGPKPIRRRCKARAIANTIKQKKCDALITDSWKSLEHIRIPKNIKVFCLAHGTELPIQPKKAKLKRIKKTLLKANIVVPNSSYTSSLLKQYINTNTIVRIINPGILGPVAVGKKTREHVEKALIGFDKVLISIARVERRKNQEIIIRLMPELLKDFPSLVYVIIGGGSQGQDLEQYAKKIGVSEHVLFLGPMGHEMAELRTAWLEKADIFVMPSVLQKNDVEGFGISYIEAGWFGVPSIAGNSGGAKEAVIDGKTGLICQSDDPESVLSSIRQLLVDDDLRKRLGENAKLRAESLLWDKVIDKYIELLQE